MTRFTLLSVLVFLCFTVSPALARDSAKDLCHRHCATEYDKYVQAKDAQSKHEKKIEKKKEDHEKLKSEANKLAQKAKDLEKECDRLFDEKRAIKSTPANSKAMADAHLKWSQCESDRTRLGREVAQKDTEVAESEDTIVYMKGKLKKFEEATRAAEDAYDECMEKCMKDPKIQEKIPDSVIGDLAPLSQIPRKSSNPDDRTVKPGDKSVKNEREKLDDGLPPPKRPAAGGGGKKVSSPDDGLPPPKRREARPEPPPAKCPDCAAFREKDVKDALKDLDDIEKTTNEIEDAHYKLLAEQSLKHQLLQDAKAELSALSPQEVAKAQALQREINVLTRDLASLKKEVADSRKRLDGWKADLKAAEKRYEKALLNLNKCNEKSCPKQVNQAVPDESKKSLIKSILGGVSIGVGVGGGGDHGGHHTEHHDSHEIEWEDDH